MSIFDSVRKIPGVAQAKGRRHRRLRDRAGVIQAADQRLAR